MTEDDAGRRVPLVAVNLTRVPWGRGPLPREVQREVMRALGREGWKGGPRDLLYTWPVVFAPSVLIGGPVLILMKWGPPRTGAFWMFGVLAVMFPLTLVFMFAIAPLCVPPRLRRVVARAAAAEGHCGSCGYELGAADAAGDAGVRGMRGELVGC